MRIVVSEQYYSRVALGQGRIVNGNGPGVRTGAAMLGSYSRGRVARGSIISSTMKASADREGERICYNRCAISKSFVPGSSSGASSMR
jgi:hypothetical protein